MNQNSNFSTTNWSVVLAAAQSDPTASRHALERLCGRYWYPVYAFVRQRGHDVHTAEDLTQGFFHFVLERQALQRADPGKGRFRTFLLTSLINFLHNERDKGQAQKRGGRHEIVSLDEDFAESVCAHGAGNGETPATLFERRWAARFPADPVLCTAVTPVPSGFILSPAARPCPRPAARAPFRLARMQPARMYNPAPAPASEVRPR